MNKFDKYGYTVVQHSAYGYLMNPTFKGGLETRSLRLKSEKMKVLQVGGLVFDTYSAAEDYAEEEMYKDLDNLTLVPNAPGEFSKHTIDGLRIYIPKTKVNA